MLDKEPVVPCDFCDGYGWFTKISFHSHDGWTCEQLGCPPEMTPCIECGGTGDAEVQQEKII